MGWIVMKTNLKPSIIAPAITASRRQKQKNANAPVPNRPGEVANMDVNLMTHEAKENESRKLHKTFTLPQMSSNLMKTSFREGKEED